MTKLYPDISDTLCFFAYLVELTEDQCDWSPVQEHALQKPGAKIYVQKLVHELPDKLDSYAFDELDDQ